MGEANRNQKAKTKNKKQTKTKDTWEYLLILYTLSLLLPLELVRLAGVLGEGPVVLIFRCEHLGELLCPLPGAGLSGGCLPREAPGGTTPVAGPALQPWSQPPQ